jgi:hypothetical protein
MHANKCCTACVFALQTRVKLLLLFCVQCGYQLSPATMNASLGCCSRSTSVASTTCCTQLASCSSSCICCRGLFLLCCRLLRCSGVAAVQIMGIAYDVNVSQWSKGEYSVANNVSRPQAHHCCNRVCAKLVLASLHAIKQLLHCDALQTKLSCFYRCCCCWYTAS